MTRRVQFQTPVAFPVPDTIGQTLREIPTLKVLGVEVRRLVRFDRQMAALGHPPPST